MKSAGKIECLRGHELAVSSVERERWVLLRVYVDGESKTITILDLPAVFDLIAQLERHEAAAING